jgi:uncharacterized protein YecE (DUF72 family)
MRAPSQFDLFGEPPRPAAAIDAAPPSGDVARVAALLPSALRLGTSSWAFPGWAGLVYDRAASPTALARDGLAAYARHPLLRAVGLDRTFYAPIPAAEFARLAAQVPADFRFLVKAHAALTAPEGRLAQRTGGASGTPLFLDPSWACDQVIAPAVEGLRDRLGTILFQFPPLALPPRRLGALLDALGRFLAALPRGPRYAVEVRNAELLDGTLGAAYLGALVSGGATHCPTVHPRMPSVLAQHDRLGAAAFPVGLVPIRWMLRRDRGYEEARDAFAPFDQLVAPDEATRHEVATLVRTTLAAGHEVLVIANNKAEGSAPRTLAALARVVPDRS